MATALGQYLDDVRDNLRLDLSSEREVLGELRTHIEDRLEEMREAGLSEEEAANTCLKPVSSNGGAAAGPGASRARDKIR